MYEVEMKLNGVEFDQWPVLNGATATSFSQDFSSLKICRLCLSDNLPLISIHSTSEQFESVPAMIEACTSVKIGDSLDLPESICMDCMKILENFCEFKKKCEISEAALNHYKQLSDMDDIKSLIRRVHNNTVKQNDYGPPINDENDCIDMKSQVEIVFVDNCDNDTKYNNAIKINPDPALDNPSGIEQTMYTVEIKDTFDGTEINYPELTEGDYMVTDEINGNQSLFYDMLDECTFLSATDKGDETSNMSLGLNESCDFLKFRSLSLSEEQLVDRKPDEKLLPVEIDPNTAPVQESNTSLVAKMENLDSFLDNQLKILNESVRQVKPDALDSSRICHICGGQYVSAYVLRNHIIQKHNTETYDCDICGFSFSGSKPLERHVQRVHKRVPPHQCKICGKTYYDKGNLSFHERQHKNPTIYKCEKCPKEFYHIKKINAHIKAKHSDEKKTVRNVQCEFCRSKFVDEMRCKLHTINKHFKQTVGKNRSTPDTTEEATTTN